MFPKMPVAHESFEEWLVDNYASAVSLWKMLQGECEGLGLRRIPDIDHERAFFTEFALILYERNRMTV
jgi:hypothetical protein